MLDAYKLYPQYAVKSDRRQQSAPVAFDRRSGMDRRSPDRVKLDTNLTKDIFVVRNSVAALHKKDMQAAQMSSETLKNIPFAGKFLSHVEKLKNQEVSKIAGNTNFSDLNLKKENKIQMNKSNTAPNAGMAAGAVATAMSLMFIGAAGAIVAAGTSFYLACKSVKNVVLTHLKK